MKIQIGYGNEYTGIAEANGDSIAYSGDEPEFLKNIVEEYQEMLNKTGNELLQAIVDRLAKRRGRTWAKIIY